MSLRISSNRHVQGAFCLFPRFYCHQFQARQSGAHVNKLKPFPIYRLKRSSFSYNRYSIDTLTHQKVQSPIYMFDKIPKKLPDWWDEDDDDEEDEDDTVAFNSNPDFESGGGSGSDGHDHGNSGGGGGYSGGSTGDSSNEGGNDGFFSAAIATYVTLVQKYPIRTKAVSTCILAFIGDLTAQKISQETPEFQYDTRRSVSIATWAFFFMGPVLHMWYGALDRLIVSGKLIPVRKMLVDQTLFAPFFNGMFLVGVGMLEGSKIQEVSERVQTKLWPSMKANWLLWPAAQMINFTIIPKTFQIIYVNGVALIWNVILTYISHDESEIKIPSPGNS